MLMLRRIHWMCKLFFKKFAPNKLVSLPQSAQKVSYCRFKWSNYRLVITDTSLKVNNRQIYLISFHLKLNSFRFLNCCSDNLRSGKLRCTLSYFMKLWWKLCTSYFYSSMGEFLPILIFSVTSTFSHSPYIHNPDVTISDQWSFCLQSSSPSVLECCSSNINAITLPHHLHDQWH